jgi:hypothetical protein
VPQRDQTRRKPAIVNLDRQLEEISLNPICDFCTKPEDVSSGDPKKIVAFDTYAELQEHRRDKHARVDRWAVDYNPEIDVQISTYESDDEEAEMRFSDASQIDINFWILDAKRYLNMPPDKRDVFPMIGNTKNLRPPE